MQKIIFNFIFLFCLLSCTGQEDEKIEKELKKCVNEEINKNLQLADDLKSINFYDLMLEIERVLLKEEVLINSSKTEYYNLFDNIKESKGERLKITYNKIFALCKDIGFDFELFIIIDTIFTKCPYETSIDYKDTQGKLMYTQAILLNQLISEGYENHIIIKDLIDIIEEEKFNKIIYRAPIIFLTLINLDRKYNPVNRKLEEQTKGKKFLNKG